MDSIYEESLANLRDRIPVYGNSKKVEQTIAEKEQAAKLYYSAVKTNVLLAWVLSNVRFSPHIKFLKLELLLLGIACLQYPERAACPRCFWT